MNIKPFPQVVVLKGLGTTETEEGIIIPGEDKKTKPEIGEVVAIGSGKKPFPFDIGDTLVFEKYLRDEIPVFGEEFIFIRFEKLVAKVER